MRKRREVNVVEKVKGTVASLNVCKPISPEMRKKRDDDWLKFIIWFIKRTILKRGRFE